MPTSTAYRTVYIPRYTRTERLTEGPLYPSYEQLLATLRSNAPPYTVSSTATQLSRNAENTSVVITPLRGLIMALLGVGAALAITIPVTVSLYESSSTTSTETTTVSTVTTVTTVAVTTVTTTSTTSTTTTTTSNQTSCTFPCVCVGISSSTLWQAYPNNSMYMNIDTSNCTFNQTPLYFTSMAGSASHYGLTGYGAIYSPTSTSFTIYIKNVFDWNSSYLISVATIDAWNVNWFGLYY
ncbi:unnamed protein product [Rotaria magnacalcarata]|uniref:Uncharacterized protein n=1 Tax=Rotaria magnacalcarata TaxID=392030 RepID=A0A815HAJ8_9BILA|nr:unnamed protein product [Rotaria magnacalcarata]CAF1591570.1 unnamed protein product [Rotaria magnacalcarata]CAF1984964.1 unnamed protein product [Rotaria magnacalcarata]CAF2081134.1 unnamed protein product [Rotaria magnacalcarata]CAF2120307.1 unnamed protein product [Rotaria magnacalcarata]